MGHPRSDRRFQPRDNAGLAMLGSTLVYFRDSHVWGDLSVGTHSVPEQTATKRSVERPEEPMGSPRSELGRLLPGESTSFKNSWAGINQVKN